MVNIKKEEYERLKKLEENNQQLRLELDEAKDWVKPFIEKLAQNEDFIEAIADALEDKIREIANEEVDSAVDNLYVGR